MRNPLAKTAREWQARHHAGLFQATFPDSADELRAAQATLRQMAEQLAALPEGDALLDALENSGIAGSVVSSSFSLAATRWLCERFGDDVHWLYLEADPTDARAILERGLDPMERDGLVDRRMPWKRWCALHLGLEPPRQLTTLIELVDRLGGSEREREAAWAQLGVFIRWRQREGAPGLTQGRFGRNRPHTHETGLWRPADPLEVWSQPAPRRVRLDAADRQQLADLGRGVMLSLLRETDFFTHVDPAQIECFDLGRGLQIALYSCHPARQLTLESYVGYLLLKNHVPVAYGGSWILGPQAAFGVNVLPPYRGGESTLLVCQLLRLYAWRFKLSVLRVEASQIARDNKESIQSGAFWFYWRLGFRPVQPKLLALAQTEWTRILQASNGRPAARFYRSDVLKQLGASQLVWHTPTQGRRAALSWHLVEPARLGERVSAHVRQQFDGDRTAAQRAALRALQSSAPSRRARLRPERAMAPDSGALARMATLLAAMAPPPGWSAAECRALRQLARLRDRHEPDFARALQGHHALMRALQALPGADRDPLRD